MIKKVLISIDEDLLSDVDNYVKKMHLSSRSAGLAVLCTTALQNQKSLGNLNKFIQTYLGRASS